MRGKTKSEGRGTNFPNAGTQSSHRGTKSPYGGTKLRSMGTNLPHAGTQLRSRGTKSPSTGTKLRSRETRSIYKKDAGFGVFSLLHRLHRQVRAAISARGGLCARPFHFVSANRRAAVRAIAWQQVGAMDGVSDRCGCGGSHRHGGWQRINGWRRRWILIPRGRAGAEESFQYNAQAHQNQNAGPPMSPEKKN